MREVEGGNRRCRNGEVIGQRHNPPNRGWISDKVEPSISPTIDRLTDEDTNAYIRVAFSGMDEPYSADERYFTRVGTSNKQMAALDLFEYIEIIYNRTRIHSALGYLSPAEFEGANWPAEDSRPNGLGQYNGHRESSVSIGKAFKLCQENATTGTSSSPP